MPGADTLFKAMQISELMRKRRQEEEVQEAGLQAQIPITAPAPRGEGTVTMGTEYSVDTHYQNLVKGGHIDEAMKLKSNYIASSAQEQAFKSHTLVNGLDYFQNTDDDKGAMAMINKYAPRGEHITALTKNKDGSMTMQGEGQEEPVTIQDPVGTFRKIAASQQQQVDLYKHDQDLKQRERAEKDPTEPKELGIAIRKVVQTQGIAAAMSRETGQQVTLDDVYKNRPDLELVPLQKKLLEKTLEGENARSAVLKAVMASPEAIRILFSSKEGFQGKTGAAGLLNLVSELEPGLKFGLDEVGITLTTSYLRFKEKKPSKENIDKIIIDDSNPKKRVKVKIIGIENGKYVLTPVN
jgi:Skp family chaperone for outer membrane proteins